MSQNIKLGISTCLLGEKVRYDGGHKLDRYLTRTLGQFVTFVPVCPEVECGMPVPREALHLVGDPQSPRLVTIRSNEDRTDQMKEWAGQRLRELEAEDLCGFIFKSKSPSSGMERVKVYSGRGGSPQHTGVGIWARAFMDHFPSLPVEEDGRLHDPGLRENFIERVFVMKRWRDRARGDRSKGDLVEFHTRHKLLLMAHSPKAYKELGKFVSDLSDVNPEQIEQEYFTRLAAALKLKATVKKNHNVLLHILGYFKKELTRDEKQEVLGLFDAYARGDVPLIVPVTLLNHFVRKYDQPYLKNQYYLSPHPLELRLRNHV